MFELTEKYFSAWMDKLPVDVRGVISDGEPMDISKANGLVSELNGAMKTIGAATSDEQKIMTTILIEKIPDILRAHPDDVRALGRAGRLRIAAFVVGFSNDDIGGAYEVFRRLIGEAEAGDETGGGSGSDALGVMFIEDIIAYVKAVTAPRLAAQLITDNTIGFAAEAAFTMEGESALRGGRR